MNKEMWSSCISTNQAESRFNRQEPRTYRSYDFKLMELVLKAIVQPGMLISDGQADPTIRDIVAARKKI